MCLTRPPRFRFSFKDQMAALVSWLGILSKAGLHCRVPLSCTDKLPARPSETHDLVVLACMHVLSQIMQAIDTP